MSLNKFFKNIQYDHTSQWKKWELILFRFWFIFLLLLIIPFDWKIYQSFFFGNELGFHFHTLFDLSKYQNDFLGISNQYIFGWRAFGNWGVFIILSILGAFIWSAADRNKTEYHLLYYWLRVLVRYRLAFILITYGVIKLFPLQMPYPSLSNLHTHYGDFFAWKIYFQTVGIAPNYQSFLGFVEILAAFLIIYRRTTTFGVGLIFGFIGNVAVVNGFYDVGELVNSTFIVLLSAFLFSYDIPRLYCMFIKRIPAKGNHVIPVFNLSKHHFLKRTLQSSFIAFVVLFTVLALQSFLYDPYKVPKNPGLKDSYGYYDVSLFILNGDTIPYSKTDPNRWQDVIFEKWSTLSIKNNKPVKIDFSSGEKYASNDIDRNYELAGLSGRHYFYYEIDSVQHVLKLQNKNIHHRSEKMLLTYERPDANKIVLKGRNEQNDSVQVVLTKIPKKYMMLEGRRRIVNL